MAGHGLSWGLVQGGYLELSILLSCYFAGCLSISLLNAGLDGRDFGVMDGVTWDRGNEGARKMYGYLFTMVVGAVVLMID